MSMHTMASRGRRRAECAVLLKNENALLPLQPSAGETIAVIGEFARTPRYQGAGSSQVTPTRLDVALDELRAAAPDGVEVAFAAGFGIGTTRDDEELAAEAVALAARAGVVVVFLGLPAGDESEGFDRAHIDLPANQIALLAHLAHANPNLVVVLANGSAVRLSDWERHAGAVLECWLSGQAAGGAVADLLFGRGQPVRSARRDTAAAARGHAVLPEFPRRGRARPLRRGSVRRLPRLRRARPRGQLSVRARPVLHELRVRRPAREVSGRVEDGDLAVEVTCLITNTGSRRGKEVVQLYVGDVEASVARPPRELRAFAKVDLDAGRERDADLPPRGPRLLLLVEHCLRLGARGRGVHAGDRRLLARSAAHDHS